jgi:ACS family tartrate transporter-like MFS transporter
MRKVTLRLIPFLVLLYIIAWLDRANVGFAALHMNADLGFSSGAFGLGSGIFFIGYMLFEIPSNLILHRIGARLWIARIMVTWGFVSVSMMFVRTPWSFYGLRFLLGAAEAGFFPGVLYYLSLWYPSAHRAKAIAGFMAAIPFTGLIGAPLSGAILGLDGAQGLAGWQWLFLLEGLPAILVGFIVPFCLTNGPEQAGWLEGPERDWLVETLARQRRACDERRHVTLREALTNRTVLLLGILGIFTSMGFYGYTYWSPVIIQSVTGASDLNVGLIVGAISAAAVAAMLLNGVHADRTGELPVHGALAVFLMASGLVGCALLRAPPLVLLSLALVPVGWCAMLPAFWSIPSRFLTGRAAAGGIAMVNSIPSIGAFLGPALMGYLKERTGTHHAAFLVLGGGGIIAASILLSLRSASGVAPSVGQPLVVPEVS